MVGSSPGAAVRQREGWRSRCGRSRPGAIAACLVLVLALGVPVTKAAAATPAHEASSWVSLGGPPGDLGYDIRVSFSDPEVWYVTDGQGGFFISTDRGATWRSSNQGIAALEGSILRTVFSATVDPHDPQTIWIGTQLTGHIYKSTDGGRSWVQKDNGVTPNQGQHFRGFTVDLASSEIVYAQAEVDCEILSTDCPEPEPGKLPKVGGRVYRTTDGGETWEIIWQGGALARYLWIDPGNPDTLYVSTGIFDRPPMDSAGVGLGVLKSIDAGQTWAVLGAAQGLTNLYVGSLYMHPQDPQTLLAGAGIANKKVLDPETGQEVLDGGVFLTTDGGEHWTKVIKNDAFGAVEFCAQDPTIAYAAGQVATYRSEDGGLTWQKFGDEERETWAPEGVYPGLPIDLQTDPEDCSRVFLNNYIGGNFLSTDGGETWTIATTGYTGAQVSAVRVDPADAAHVYAITRMAPFASRDGGRTWEGLSDRVMKTSVNQLAADPSDADHLLGSQGRKYLISRDGGQSWEAFEQFAIPPDVGEDEPYWMSFSDFAFAPSNPAVVYATSKNDASVDSDIILPPAKYPGLGIFRSADGGDTWQPANDADTEGEAFGPVVVHPTDPLIVYAAGHYDAGVFKTTDGGQTWTPVNSGLPATYERFYAMAMEPGSPDTLILSGKAGVFKTTNGGGSWTQLTSGLDAFGKFKALVYDPTDGQVVYIGSNRLGISYSTDGGETFKPLTQGLDTGLGGLPVKSLGISADGSVLYAGTHGAGVFRLGAASFLPDSDQRSCYAGVLPYAVIDCAGTGQDGAFLINSLKYTDKGDDTVVDNNSGLVWEQAGASGKSWQEAVDYCLGLDLGSATDWRLPSRRELVSIIDYAVPSPGPTINGTFFPGTAPTPHWTSTLLPGDPQQAWRADFDFGGVQVGDLSLTGSVRCVRGGEAPVPDHLFDGGDGTVTDARTGLIWQRDTGTGGDWAAALGYCDGLALGGSRDWRLPNIKEIESLVDLTAVSPAIDGDFFPATYREDYWASTTCPGDPGQAWNVDFDDGHVGCDVKTAPILWARCVRGGERGALDPLAVDDAAAAGEDAPTVIGVLANDLDPFGHPLAVIHVTQGTHGGVVVDGTAVTYTPEADYFGPDSFTYTVGDGRGNGDAATVSISVYPVNDAPAFAKGADQTVLEDCGSQTVTGWATAVSAGPANESGQVLTFDVTGNTSPGLFAAGPAVDAATGDLTFAPALNAHGSATISVTLSDDGGTAGGGVDTSAPQSFTITVTPVNDPPVARDDAAATEQGVAVTIPVLANDSDPDGDPAILESVGAAAHGVTAVDGTSVRYTPGAGWSGTDNFSYTSSDGKGGTAVGAVTVSVAPVLRVTSNGTLDGWVLESTESGGRGGTLNASAATVLVGDDRLDRQYRAVLSFNTSSLPDDAVISSATLKLRRRTVAGADPFQTHGFLLVDVIRGAFSGNGALQASDFQAAATQAGAMRVPRAIVDGWYSATLGAAARSLVNPRGLTQVRLRFAKGDDDDGGADCLVLYSGSAAANLRPLLEVRYSRP